MTVFRHELPLTLTLVSPFATRGMSHFRSSIDTPLARNANGEFIMPGTLIKGVLLAAMRVMADLDPSLAPAIQALFGAPSKETEEQNAESWSVANTPIRGLLGFRDLLIVPGQPVRNGTEQSYTRIKIDEARQSVEEGSLQFVEMPFDINQDVDFEGVIDLRMGSVAPEEARRLLDLAWGLVPAIGSMKSIGFGRVKQAVLNEPRAIEASLTQPEERQFDVDYVIDRPFLVGGHMASQNLFVGDVTIPGGAIKGTLATALCDAQLMDERMSEFLSKLTIGHARPRQTSTTKSLYPPPLSLATVGPDKIVCALAAGEDTLMELDVAALFAGDSKADGLFDVCMGQTDDDRPKRDIRTRTKIDPATGTASYEDGSGQLFSQSAVEPDGFTWHGRVLAPDGYAPQWQIVWSLLKSGLIGLGKSGAGIKMVSSIQRTVQNCGGQQLFLTVVTPALMNNPDALRSGVTLRKDYEAYWQTLGLRLINFFASQRLEGGYVALRYPPDGANRQPYLLTEPGSVFLVETQDGIDLEDLLQEGLPVNSWHKQRDWQHCPYLPENGFGEIMRDLIDHTSFARPLDPKTRKAA